MFLLGEACLRGPGFARGGPVGPLLDELLPEDASEGVRWMRESARLGHERAMLRLGEVLELGCCGLAPHESDVEAAMWYRAAASRGSTAGMLGIAVLCEDGRCGLAPRPSLAEAAHWYREAVAAGVHGADMLLELAEARLRGFDEGSAPGAGRLRAEEASLEQLGLESRVRAGEIEGARVQKERERAARGW
jgi:TPR repeat protein